MRKWKIIKLIILALTIPATSVTFAENQKSNNNDRMAIGNRGALAGHRYRVIVSSDIGGTDPDDLQSMVHFLVYADVLDIEGIISSPFGPGQEERILQVIDCYETDYANLKTYSDQYPTPDALRAITKQGGSERATYTGVRQSTEGSQWIIECARRDDPRPLHVLVWGGIMAFVPPPEMAQRPSSQLPNWWTDDPSEDVTEGEHIGAKTVSQWREDFLSDFAAHMLRCKSPASPRPMSSKKGSAQ